MQDMTNTLLSNIPFKKTWVDENGAKISENILGDGIELGVEYKLQVLSDGAAEWQDAGQYFSAVLPLSLIHISLGQRSRIADVDALRDCAPFVRVIGDAAKVSTITNAVYWGYHAALDI